MGKLTFVFQHTYIIGQLYFDISHDEAIATRGMHGGMNGMGGGGRGGGYPMAGGGVPMDHAAGDQFGRNREDPPDASQQHEQHGDDAKSVASGTSALMGGAQNRLKQKRMEKM